MDKMGVSASGVMRLRLRRSPTNETTASSFDFGFGFEVADRGQQPTLQVSKLIADSEAERSGLLRVGDIILKVNGVEVAACTFDEALQTLASTPAGAYASFLVRAPFGFSTQLVTTFAEDGTPSTMRITERASRKLSASPVPSVAQQAAQDDHLAVLLQSTQLLSAPASVSQRKGSITGLKPIRLRNVSSSQVNLDVLHHSATQPLACTETVCLGSLMKQTKEHLASNGCPVTSNNVHGIDNAGAAPTHQQMLADAYQFMEQFYASIKRLHSPAHRERLREIDAEMKSTATYQLKQTELIFGAKLAWRNAPRCIGRIQWSKLQVFDARGCTTARDMFEAICNQIKYATNRGNLRSAITIFPQRVAGREDFRIWNQQLISYAGYEIQATDGLDLEPGNETSSAKTIIGDPANVEFTQICQKLGWKSAVTRWDVLPIVVNSPGEDPQLFVLPEELIVRVPLIHPKYDWFEHLDLQWYALPAVSSMKFDVGGIEFPACPFSGWYMDTEIAVRDLSDTHRYNVLPLVAERLGLDVSSNASLWRDRAVIEMNAAVLYSYQRSNVTIVDHFTAGESFMKHLENEYRLRGGCPADWVWIVPPISGSLLPVFHQEMLSYDLKPSYRYQEPAWKSHNWRNGGGLDAERGLLSAGNTPRKLRFKEIAKAVKFTSNLFGKALSKRIKATILYATETGRSEQFAKRLGQIFSHAFNVSVSCMDSYDALHLEHETLLLIVTSTFGNGDPPENGESLAKQLQAIKVTGDTAPEVDRNKISLPISYLRYSSLDVLETGQQSGESRPGEELNRTSPNSPRVVNSASSSDCFFANHVGPLSNIRFGVFALGSSAYPNFCAYGRYLDTVLAELGGERISKLGLGDELCGQEHSFNLWATEAFRLAVDVFCLTDEFDMSEVMKRATQKPLLWSKQNIRLEVNDDFLDQVDGDAQATNIEQALRKLSNNKKVIRYRLVERENLLKMDNKSESAARQTIRVVLQIDLPGGEEMNEDIKQGAYYLPGDHLAVYPENNATLVDAIVDRLLRSEPNRDNYADRPYLVKIKAQNSLENGDGSRDSPVGLFAALKNEPEEEKWMPHERLPAPVSLREALLRYLDITTPPTQQFLTLSAEYAESKKEAERLRHLASDSSDYEAWKAKLYPNLLEVLNEFHSLRLPLEAIFTQLPLLQPRYYSISSSPLSNSASHIELTVAVVQYQTTGGAQHYGVCSNFLKDIALHSHVFGFIRAAPNFRMPKQREVPVIMVGPGTGIAPFRSFWRHRARLRELNLAEYGTMRLFFGCRFESMQLYKDEIMAMLNDNIITEYCVAFSRKPGEPKKYVQDLMKAKSQQIFADLTEHGGHIYVCGDVSMAEDVNKTLKAIFVQNGVVDGDGAIFSLKENQHYHEDIFGITLRTEETTTRGRNDAMVKRTLSTL